MNVEIKLHKNDLPEDLNLGKSIAIDGEFGGLNPFKDKLCLIQNLINQKPLSSFVKHYYNHQTR